jgi:DNA-binding MarR family transcriptional regulator
MATKMIPPRSLGRQLNFTTGRMNALCQKLLDPYDLSLPQWVVLSCLWREPQLSVGVISEMVGTGLPATSRIIERMTDRGLVTRQQHKTDGRVMIVTPTKKGLDLSHLADFYERINVILFNGFSENETRVAFDLLLRMQMNAEDALS